MILVSRPTPVDIPNKGAANPPTAPLGMIRPKYQ